MFLILMAKNKKHLLVRYELKLIAKQWGINVPARRKKGKSPTFGDIVLFFFEKSSTRTYYLMDFSETPHRGAEIWHIWKQHHLIEFFWKMLKSVFKINSMQLQGDGLYAGLLVKMLSYLLAIRLKGLHSFSKMSLIQIMRKIQREYNLETLAMEHFHLYNSIT
jgi:hypothetical protein